MGRTMLRANRTDNNRNTTPTRTTLYNTCLKSRFSGASNWLRGSVMPTTQSCPGTGAWPACSITCDTFEW